MSNWLTFGALSLIWGSSYLLIKIGVEKLDTLSLVSGRLGVTAIAFIIAFAVMGKRLPGQLAVLLASACYGFGAVFVRRNLRHIDPMVNAGATMMISAACVIAVTLLTVHPLPNVAALQPRVQLAVLGLGLVNTFIA